MHKQTVPTSATRHCAGRPVGIPSEWQQGYGRRNLAARAQGERRRLQIALKQRRQRRVIDGSVRIVLFNERTARGLDWIRDFPCRGGATTRQARRAVHEVHVVVDALLVGRADPIEVVVAYDDQDAPVSFAVVRMDGDTKVTREPYIEAIARHDQFHRAVLSDCSTSAAGAAMRGVLDMLALHYGRGSLPSITARVLEGNVRSRSIFTRADFAPLPRSNTSADPQIVYQRPSRTPLPPPLDPSVYVPPCHLARPSVRVPPGGRNAPCWCGNGKKFKRCHGAGADDSAERYLSPDTNGSHPSRALQPR